MTSSALTRELEASNLLPLWLHIGKTVSDQPRATEKAFHWPWSTLRLFAEQAGDQVGLDQAERRVLVLSNPQFGGKPVTTGTLNAAVQILNPGEAAEPHRHSMAAIRLITGSDGGTTTVNDFKFPMSAGDLILTPAWCWHGHFNDTAGRALWIDVLDVPLVAGWDGVFFEHAHHHSPKLKDATAFPDAAWSGQGIVQSNLAPTKGYSPKLRYSWAETKPVLDAVSADADGRREIRYVNPTNGAPVMPTIDCYATRLQQGRTTRLSRSTASTLCHVVEGRGTSSVGGENFTWAKGDVFTIPHWQWASHTADAEPAYIVQVTNRGMLSDLGLLRDETRSDRKNGSPP